MKFVIRHFSWSTGECVPSYKQLLFMKNYNKEEKEIILKELEELKDQDTPICINIICSYKRYSDMIGQEAIDKQAQNIKRNNGCGTIWYISYG
jgi:hypothetical protein